MRGFQTSCLYSFGCPELKKMESEKIILDFIKNPKKENIPSIKEILEKIEPFLFYQLIGLQNGIVDPFNEDIVSAYWLGNSLLKPITRGDINNFLSQKRNFGYHQLHLIKILGLIGGKPHHNFGTLWLAKGIKNNQRSPPKFLENLNNCFIRIGRVIEIEKLKLKAEIGSIVFQGKEIVLDSSIEEVNRGFIEKIERGNLISIHLGMAREKIQRETAENLSKITKEATSFFKGRK